ncbi:hypothetical protein [Stigmatella erecta]|uniref:TadE-like protein n=1 Tax=Stigmatella erecta TaxID=83460 RepID=A0A1I0L0I2_9BACT|nr:hypothetical protein [Stigmatella erecta]SEU31773.1 hypothetical protein SAMN05443639_11698 [Stigmatella erecta]
MRHDFRKQRGAASVEAALSMIIIIPTFMYALFLDDLLRYAADVQETVTSTPWDFTSQNYAHPEEGGTAQNGTKGGLASVEHNARLMYCDHESSGDSYDRGQDCDSEDHHTALSGHVCWMNDGAEQVTCDAVDQSVGNISDWDFTRYKDDFATGGLYQCHAQAIVENYLMPKTFLQKFSQVDMSKENWKGKGTIHGNAQSGTDDTAYYLAKQHFALVTDTMALTYAGGGGELAVKPGEYSGDVYTRTESVFAENKEADEAFGAYKAFVDLLTSNELLQDVGSEDPKKPNVSMPAGGSATQSIEEDKGSRDYFATPWNDGAGDRHRETGEARGNHYMGCKTEEGC